LSSIDDRLKKAVQLRDELNSNIQRINGRLEAARKNLSEVEKECRDKGYDPDTLSETVKNLQEKYERAVASLETQLSAAQASLQPYMEKL
jgi:chromosome segregation ATPase